MIRLAALGVISFPNRNSDNHARPQGRSVPAQAGQALCVSGVHSKDTLRDLVIYVPIESIFVFMHTCIAKFLTLKIHYGIIESSKGVLHHE